MKGPISAAPMGRTRGREQCPPSLLYSSYSNSPDLRVRHAVPRGVPALRHRQGIGTEPQLRTIDGAYRWSLCPHERPSLENQRCCTQLLLIRATDWREGQNLGPPRIGLGQQSGSDKQAEIHCSYGVAMSAVFSQRTSPGLFGT